MNDKPKAYIAGMGMITPVGFNTEMTVASVRAGINRYQDTNRLNGRFDQIKMALVPDDALPRLSDKLVNTMGITSRQSRMLCLADPAIREALNTYVEPVPLYLAGPEPVPSGPGPIRSAFIEHLVVQTGLNIDIKASKVFPIGRAGVFYAVDYAFELLLSTDRAFVLVGGVDSYWDGLALGLLSRDARVQTVPGEMDAFVPGEGAGFLLLTKDKRYQTVSRVLSRPGIASENGHRYSDQPYLGDGLADAFRLAIENGFGQPIKKIYSSLNGESFGNKEFGVAVTRSSSYLLPDFVHEHPADCFGDLGGALGAVLLGLALKEESGATICYGASDNEYRGAICVC